MYVCIYIIYIYISGENRVPGYPRIPGSITILQVSTHVIFFMDKDLQTSQAGQGGTISPPKANEVLVFLIMWFPSYLLITYYKYVQIKDQI